MKNIDCSFFDIIGKTPEYCQEKYGSPHLVNSNFKFYKKKDFRIIIEFFCEKSVEISFRKMTGVFTGAISCNPKKLSDDEIQDILKANGGEIEWCLLYDNPEKKTWVIYDNENLFASYDKLLNIFRLILINECQHIERLIEINEALLSKKPL